MSLLNTLMHQSSMREIDLLDEQLDPCITYTGGPKWYHGADGLLRDSTVNYLLWSNDFTNAVWTKANATVTGNAVTGPGNVGLMDTITDDATSGYHGIWQTGSSTDGRTYARSFIVKRGTSRYISFSSNSATNGVVFSWVFDFDTATFTYTGTGSLGQEAVSLGDGTYRITFVIAANGGSTSRIYVGLSNGPTRADTDYAGVGSLTVHVAKAQYELGESAGIYAETTSAPAYTWPLEYDPITLQPLGRSGWEARTNIAIFSEDLASRTLSDLSVVSNAAIGPDGVMSMDKLVEAATTASHYCYVSVSIVSGNTYTHSCYAKAAERGAIYMSLGGGCGASFNLLTGVVNFADGVGANWSAVTATIQHVGNGVYRCTATGTRTGANVGTTQRIGPASTATFAGAQESYAGDGASGVYVFGAQVEQASNVGPYIPTQGSQVTRPIDLPLVTNIEDLLRFPGQEGTVYLEVMHPLADMRYTFAQIDDGDSALDDDWLFYTNNNFNQLVCRLYPGGAHAGANVVSNGVVNKFAIAADAVENITCVNGETPKVGAFGCSQVGMQRLYLGRSSSGSGASGAYIRKVRFYPCKLSGSELQELTA